jgi:hypothetical protein
MDASERYVADFLAGHRFGRPLEPWKILEPKIRDSLTGFMNNNAANEAKSWKLGRRFELEVSPATKLFRTFYVMGSYVDRESVAG